MHIPCIYHVTCTIIIIILVFAGVLQVWLTKRLWYD